MALFASAPAFNADLRRANVFDQPVLAVGRDMYDRSSYLMQQAVSFIRADLLPYQDDPDRLTAPVEVVAERGARAAELMRESLALNPGNAQGWAVMAWAQLYAGDTEAARTALRASWRLAPHNRSLSAERIDLALVLLDPLTEDLPDLPSDADRAAILRDLETLRRTARADDFAYYRDQVEMSDLGLSLPDPA